MSIGIGLVANVVVGLTGEGIADSGGLKIVSVELVPTTIDTADMAGSHGGVATRNDWRLDQKERIDIGGTEVYRYHWKLAYAQAFIPATVAQVVTDVTTAQATLP